jgi:DNA-binding Lrp family transcriptional regulator
MPTAYVLINCELGEEDEIIRTLKTLPSVNEVNGIYGAHDILVKIQADSMDKVRETITWHMRKIDRIKSTLTLVVIEGQADNTKYDIRR